MGFVFEINFFFLVIGAITMLSLGLFVFFRGGKNITSKLFLTFTIVSASWSILNYASFNTESLILILWLIRSVMFFAVFQALSFFLLVYVFPKSSHEFPAWIKLVLLPITAGVAILTLSPLVFSRVELGTGSVPEPIPGPGIALFAILAVSLVVGGVAVMIRRAFRATGTEGTQLKYLLAGVAGMFALILGFNFILPVFFRNTSFIPISSLFVLPFVITTTYAILKHQLLNIRVIATEIFAVAIALLFLMNTFLADTVQNFITNGISLILVSIFSFMLVRGTLREIRELERLSRAKSEFVSIVSHQLRTPLTAIKGFISMIKENSGTEKDRKNWLEKTYISNERLIRLVNDILNISRIERGTLQYNFKEIDIIKLIDGIIEELRGPVESKGISMAWEKPSGSIPLLHADEEKLRQIFINLIDNATKYTEKGSVIVRLIYLKDLKKVRVVVQDTGIGMKKEDMEKLFDLFSRGEGGEKTHTEGVGLGLYVAKKIVEAHKGNIRAESEGPHRGSKFSVDLPVQ